MSKVLYCDKCKGKQDPADKSILFSSWTSVHLSYMDLKLKKGGVPSYISVEFCPKCAKLIVPKILNIIHKR